MPKQLTLSTPLQRDQRTLIWLQQQNPTVAWSRWDGIVSSLADYHRWYEAESRLVGMVLLEGEGDAFLEDLYLVAKEVPMILLSRAILSLKSEDYWTDNFDNLLCLDDVIDSYPFLITPWDGSAEDAVAIMALLCRYRRVVDVTAPRLSDVPCEYGIHPPATCLITQYFVSCGSLDRSLELRECLLQNCKSLYIDTIVLLNETDLSHEWADIPGSEKITQVVIGKRLTYYDALAYIKKSVPTQTIAIIANADIYFDETLLDLWKLKGEDRMLALLRWDVTSDGITLFGPRPDSQDTWILWSDSVKCRQWDEGIFGFPFGQPGCDNVFAGHMLRQRFLLANPALSIKTLHLHQSGIRTYSKTNVVPSDLYVALEPTHLLDSAQVQVPHGSPHCICHGLVPFEIRSASLSDEITYCTMLDTGGRYKWIPAEQNRYFEPAIPVYTWRNACVTPTGLVYDAYTVYTGRHAEKFQYWKGAHVDIFTPLQKTKRMIAIPFADDSVFLNPDTYVLQYLSRAYRLLEEYPGASIWIPNGIEVDAAGIPWGTGCWAEEVVGFLPGPLELGQEDVMALRCRLPAWQPYPSSRRCVIVTDSVLTMSFVRERLAPLLVGWDIVAYDQYDSIVGASLCILVGGAATKWSKLWALPNDCCVIEFQQELAIEGEFQHLCHVSGWKSWVLLLAKGPAHDIQDQIGEQFVKWYKRNRDELV